MTPKEIGRDCLPAALKLHAKFRVLHPCSYTTGDGPGTGNRTSSHYLIVCGGVASGSLEALYRALKVNIAVLT